MLVCPIAADSGATGALSEPSRPRGEKTTLIRPSGTTNWPVDGEQAGPLLFWLRSADRSSRKLLNAQSVGMPGDATGPSLRAHQQGRLHMHDLVGGGLLGRFFRRLHDPRFLLFTRRCLLHVG